MFVAMVVDGTGAVWIQAPWRRFRVDPHNGDAKSGTSVTIWRSGRCLPFGHRPQQESGCCTRIARHCSTDAVSCASSSCPRPTAAMAPSGTSSRLTLRCGSAARRGRALPIGRMVDGGGRPTAVDCFPRGRSGWAGLDVPAAVRQPEEADRPRPGRGGGLHHRQQRVPIPELLLADSRAPVAEHRVRHRAGSIPVACGYRGTAASGCWAKRA